MIADPDVLYLMVLLAMTLWFAFSDDWLEQEIPDWDLREDLPEIDTNIIESTKSVQSRGQSAILPEQNMHSIRGLGGKQIPGLYNYDTSLHEDHKVQ